MRIEWELVNELPSYCGCLDVTVNGHCRGTVQYKGVCFGPSRFAQQRIPSSFFQNCFRLSMLYYCTLIATLYLQFIKIISFFRKRIMNLVPDSSKPRVFIISSYCFHTALLMSFRIRYQCLWAWTIKGYCVELSCRTP